MKNVLLIIISLISFSVTAQHIDTGCYIIHSRPLFSGYYFTFLNDTGIKFNTFGCTERSEGMGIYKFTDSQLIITFFQHPDDTFIPSAKSFYNGDKQNDSIEISLKLLDEFGYPYRFKAYTLNKDTFSAGFIMDTSYTATFKIHVNNLPCTVTALPEERYQGKLFKPITLSLPRNTFITTNFSFLELLGLAQYYKAGDVLVFDVEDVSPAGFMVVHSKQTTPRRYRFEK